MIQVATCIALMASCWFPTADAFAADALPSSSGAWQGSVALLALLGASKLIRFDRVARFFRSVGGERGVIDPAEVTVKGVTPLVSGQRLMVLQWGDTEVLVFVGPGGARTLVCRERGSFMKDGRSAEGIERGELV